MPIIEFVPANGFVAESYAAFFKEFSPAYTLQYLSLYGHSSLAQPLRNWQGLTNELLAHLERVAPKEQVIGIGHSMGGVLLLQAYRRSPERFSHLLIIDAPIFHPLKQWALYIAQHLRVIGYGMPIARKAKRRRQHWPSREAMHADLSAKPFFQQFSPESLKNYITYGTKRTTNGVSLQFSREVECEIFKNIPPFFKGIQLGVPTYYLYSLRNSSRNSFFKKMDITFLMRTMPGATFVAFANGHLFPLEDPSVAASLVQSLIEGGKSAESVTQ